MVTVRHYLLDPPSTLGFNCRFLGGDTLLTVDTRSVFVTRIWTALPCNAL